MRLLKITDGGECAEELDQHFESVQTVDLEKISPQVIDGQPDLKINGLEESFDTVYAEIPVENAVFGRVLLEMIEEKAIPVNYSSTSFFAMAKKNYLYYVLHEKNVSAAKTAVVADEKAARNLENHIKGPLIARKFEDLAEVEKKKIDTVEGIGAFTEGVDYGENFLLFQEYSEGGKYRCLVAGDEVISLEDISEGWELSDENLRYANVPGDVKEMVLDAKNALGARVAEVLVRDQEIVDLNPNPDLELYSDVSGKDVYKNLSSALKQEEGV
ncbi:MAG: hypothetical protein ABEK16_02485 [Candidatus Nanohalobium sp.]